jgi:hypothetical protein
MTHVVGIKKAGASSLVLAVCLGAFFLWPHATPAHAYTVDGVINGVRHHPEAWIGHTILVRGSVLAQADNGCLLNPHLLTGILPYPHRCLNQRLAWFYLGPINTTGSLSVVIRPPVTLNHYVVHPGQGVHDVGTPGLVSTASPLVPTLSVQVRPDASPPELRQIRSLFPNIIYTLPAIGSTLSRLFPPNDAITLSIHLTKSWAQTCVAHRSTPCSDGMLLTSRP